MIVFTPCKACQAGTARVHRVAVWWQPVGGELVRCNDWICKRCSTRLDRTEPTYDY